MAVSLKMKRLRIFFAADHTPNARIASSQLWYNNLYLPLVDLGHEVISFEYDLSPHFRNLNPSYPEQKAFIKENRPKLETALLKQVEEAHRDEPLDLFFSYFYSACIRPETVRAIHDMGIVTVNWYCNAAHQFHLIQEIAPAFDYCLVPEKFRLVDYRRIGANPIYCQEAANPNTYRPFDVPKEYDVTFVGQCYGERPSLVRQILNAGIDLRVWGPGWHRYSASRDSKHFLPEKVLRKAVEGLSAVGATKSWKPWSSWVQRLLKKLLRETPDVADKKQQKLPVNCIGGILSDEEVVKMYSRSKINLGFSACGSTTELDQRILQIRLRDFEVPMCGGFYLVEYTKELEDFFAIGDEIVCYRNFDDLVDKIRYYLSHKNERKAIAEAGRRRCLKDHSWHRRFTSAFREMGLLQ